MDDILSAVRDLFELGSSSGRKRGTPIGVLRARALAEPRPEKPEFPKASHKMPLIRQMLLAGARYDEIKKRLKASSRVIFAVKRTLNKAELEQAAKARSPRVIFDAMKGIEEVDGVLFVE